ncbi:MAG: hypothetical protein ACTS73_06220 [Arsenophonus sp. NEOnobi-MAG3]
MKGVFCSELSILQQKILIHAINEGTEMIAYALNKNKALHQRLTTENNLIRVAFLFLLGQISQQLKLTPKTIKKHLTQNQS